MAIKNCTLYAENYAAEGIAYSEEKDNEFPIANLLSDDFGYVSRGTQSTTQTIRGDFDGKRREIFSFALKHALDTESEIEFRLLDDWSYDPSNIVYSVELGAVTPFYGWGEGDWHDTDASTGGYLDSQLEAINHEIIHCIDGISATNYEIIITQESGYPELIYLYVGGEFSPAHNVLRNPMVKIIDNSSKKRTRAGTTKFVRRPKKKLMEITWPIANIDENVQLLDIISRVGSSGIVAITLHPGEDSFRENQTSFFAYIVDLPEQRMRIDSLESRYEMSMLLEQA